jgi:hypothetical protein
MRSSGGRSFFEKGDGTPAAARGVGRGDQAQGPVALEPQPVEPSGEDVADGRGRGVGSGERLRSERRQGEREGGAGMGGRADVEDVAVGEIETQDVAPVGAAGPDAEAGRPVRESLGVPTGVVAVEEDAGVEMAEDADEGGEGEEEGRRKEVFWPGASAPCDRTLGRRSGEEETSYGHPGCSRATASWKRRRTARSCGARRVMASGRPVWTAS